MKMDDIKIQGRDFRIFLQNELLLRCKKNPKYSLRALARHLGISHSALSEILGRKRRLTHKMLEKLSHRLGISAKDRQPFLLFLQNEEKVDGKGQGALPGGNLTHYHELDLDTFNIIADWYNFAIIELFSLSNFQQNPKWIARALGISQLEASLAIERLLRVGFLTYRNGRLRPVQRHSTTLGHPESALALRKMQKQILEKAMEALEHTPLDRRDQSSMILSMDTEDLPEAKRRMAQFRRELTQFLERKGKKKRKEIYMMSLSLYPITNFQQQKENL